MVEPGVIANLLEDAACFLCLKFGDLNLAHDVLFLLDKLHVFVLLFYELLRAVNIFSNISVKLLHASHVHLDALTLVFTLFDVSSLFVK